MDAPELKFATVTAEGAVPERWLLFLHGIFGRGGNWRAIARRLVTARPTWGAALVDLRMHGASQGLPPPHTVAQAAADLDGVVARLPGPVRGILGHSFGGKVALSFVERHGGALDEAWIIDASPSAGVRASRATEQVLAVLSSLGGGFASRAAFVARMQELGFEPAIAEWMAMNLVREGDGYRLGLDFTALGAMLEDFFSVDFWPLLADPPGTVRFRVVIGEHSETIPPADRERLEHLGVRSTGRVRVHRLPAGHWVHVDDPEGLLGLLVQHLV